MTTEPSQDGEPAQRKFDDVASLFGTIVPPPGTPMRPMRPFRPIPTSLPPKHVPAVEPEPEPEPEFFAEPVRDDEPPLPIEPSLSARPRPTEIPWPDAFEPRPNFRPQEPRQWTWLLLIPAGLVAAAAVTLVDTAALRSWVDANLLHRAPSGASIDSPLLPAPFRPAPASTTSAPPTSAPPTPAPDAPPPAPAEPPILTPAIPTSPVPVPPGTEVSPPPVDAAQAAAAAAAPVHVTIQYRRNIPGAEGEARRLAALLQGVGGSIELRPNATTVRSPTINYYNPADREAASALALVLAHEATSWTVRLGTAKNPLGTLDVWLP